MDGKLPQWMKNADSNMKGNPHHRQPARPVLSAEHEGSTEDRSKLGQFDPDGIRRKGPSLTASYP